MHFGGVLFISLFLTYNFSEKKQIVCSSFIGIEYAIIDEIHQLFVGERAGRLEDVFIDSIGILIGICFTLIIYKLIIKRKKADKNK